MTTTHKKGDPNRLETLSHIQLDILTSKSLSKNKNPIRGESYYLP